MGESGGFVIGRDNRENPLLIERVRIGSVSQVPREVFLRRLRKKKGTWSLIPPKRTTGNSRGDHFLDQG